MQSKEMEDSNSSGIKSQILVLDWNFNICNPNPIQELYAIRALLDISTAQNGWLFCKETVVQTLQVPRSSSCLLGEALAESGELRFDGQFFAHLKQLYSTPTNWS